MKIVAGLGSPENYLPYVEAGADELFCGYSPDDWLLRCGVTAPINRREVLLCPVQITAFEDMLILAKRIRRCRVPVAVTFNSAFYPPSLYPLIIDSVKRLTDIGFERLILADPALILHLRQQNIGCRIHLSGEWGETNTLSLALAGKWSIDRVIFHRKMSMEAMKACTVQSVAAEYEAFVLNERCYYTGAFCQSLHCDEMPPLCRVPARIGGVHEPITPSDEPSDEPDPFTLGGSGCGLCALERLESVGVTHLKLVGRGNHPDCMIRDIRSLRQALSILESTRGTGRYPAAMKSTLFGSDGCPGKCYYPR